MRYIKSFKLIKENRFKEQWAILSENPLLYIKKYGQYPSLNYLNIKISSYIKSKYSEPNNRMVNNMTIFRRYIQVYNIKSTSEFLNRIMSDFDNVYGPDGDFYNKYTKPILQATMRKGSNIEKRALEKFKEYAKSKGRNIEIKSPTDKEDIDGIDGKFVMNNKTYLIQVKSTRGYIQRHQSRFKIETLGSLSVRGGRENEIQYLILSNSRNFLILGNTKRNPIYIKNKWIVFDKYNVLYNDYKLI